MIKSNIFNRANIILNNLSFYLLRKVIRLFVVIQISLFKIMCWKNIICHIYISVTKRTPLVYFTTKDVKNLSPSNGDVIVYTTIMTSSDVSGYDVRTGKFTAPVNGLYMFSVNSCHNTNWATVAIVKNNEVLIASTQHDTNNQSCHTVQTIATLVPGDKVWVKCNSTCRLYAQSNMWNTFSGALLQAITGHE